MTVTYSKSLEQVIPMVQENGLNTAKNINFDSGSNTCALPASTTIGGSAVVALATITSASANAFTVGLNGTTGPAFNVDASTATQADGINIKGLAAGNGANVSVITTGTNSPLTIDAAGSGTIGIGLTSTGVVTVKPATTVTGVLTATAGVTSPVSIALKSATAVPATAGAIAAGAPLILNSNLITIEATSDVPTHARPKGSLCINLGGNSVSTRLYVATDAAGTWTAITTVA